MVAPNVLQRVCVRIVAWAGTNHNKYKTNWKNREDFPNKLVLSNYFYTMLAFRFLFSFYYPIIKVRLSHIL